MTLLKGLARLTRGWRAPSPPPETPNDDAFRQAAHRGDQARNRGDWANAAIAYAEALALKPDHVAVRVQLGHGLKELGRLPEAEAAYRAAAELSHDGEIHLHLGHVLKLQGRKDEALAAYAEALRRDANLPGAREELIAGGGRSLLPDAAYGRSPTTEALTGLSTALREQTGRLRAALEVSTFPVEAYDAFRHDFPLVPPPQRAAPRPVLVLIDMAEAEPHHLRLTLNSLLDQSVLDWTAVVRADPKLAQHPAASLARIEPRIRFVGPEEVVLNDTIPAECAILLCDAGLALEADALAWLLFALDHGAAEVAYADHDHHQQDWRRGRRYADPVFQGMPDAWDLTTTPVPPAAVLVAPGLVELVSAASATAASQSLRRQVLLDAVGRRVPIAHVPLLLASRRMDSEADGAATQPIAESSEAASRADVVIRVIIPTRDEPEMLKACIQSLIASAARPERLEIVIVDNRSRLVETAELFRSVTQDPRIQVLEFDEPFNWSRLNNLGAQPGGDGIVVFANNDVEMLTQDWDDRLRGRLAEPEIGVVGVRLLYPDGSVQHAGVVFGVYEGRPVHDGLGRAGCEPGPNARWLRAHQAAAVTGALMAARSETFRALGGFDEHLSVGYSDLDLCLKARAAGLAVLYDPSVELIHHESRTRGRSHGAAARWDDEELTDFHARWGDWMMFDPGVNPHWTSVLDRVFDGLRMPTRAEVLDHVIASARQRPWSVSTDGRPPLRR